MLCFIAHLKYLCLMYWLSLFPVLMNWKREPNDILAQGISLVYGMSGFGKKVILYPISSLICFVLFCFSLFHILNYQFIFYNIAFCIFPIMNSILLFLNAFVKNWTVQTEQTNQMQLVDIQNSKNKNNGTIELKQSRIIHRTQRTRTMEIDHFKNIVTLKEAGKVASHLLELLCYITSITWTKM
jgi:hypothetical protein